MHVVSALYRSLLGCRCIFLVLYKEACTNCFLMNRFLVFFQEGFRFLVKAYYIFDISTYKQKYFWKAKQTLLGTNVDFIRPWQVVGHITISYWLVGVCSQIEFVLTSIFSFSVEHWLGCLQLFVIFIHLDSPAKNK